MSAPIFRMLGVGKRFGATVALEDVSFALERGKVRALVGQNGAGKSTLMNVLAGVVAPDAGSMELDGRPFAPKNPADAHRAGVAMIHQELSIAPDLSVVENVMLGNERARAGFVRTAVQRDVARRALARLGHGELDLGARCGSLQLARQQVVEIARALAQESKVLVFDEPTSSLARDDAERLFGVIRELAAQGLAVVYISHFLEEVASTSDVWTCLCDGRVVAEGSMRDTALGTIVAHMAGRAVDETREPARDTRRATRVPHELGEPVLELAGLAGPRLPHGIDLVLRSGEVFGLAGLVGAGPSELLRAVFGLDRVTRGSVRLRGRPFSRRPLGPRAGLRAGLGFVSEDRKGEGLLLSMSIEDNLTLTRLGPYSRMGWLALSKRRAAARTWIERVRCKCTGPTQTIAALSGGNQQKIAIARLLHQDADVLLLDEPTRGIDVGTKSEIYGWIAELAAAGKTILMTSSHTPELLQVCDRVGVMRRGELVAVRDARDWTAESILSVATGTAEAEA